MPLRFAPSSSYDVDYGEARPLETLLSELAGAAELLAGAAEAAGGQEEALGHLRKAIDDGDLATAAEIRDRVWEQALPGLPAVPTPSPICGTSSRPGRTGTV